jgi:CMP-N-acetylneuraminic acid synthetase
MPLFINNALFAKRSKYIRDVYITTDDQEIKNIAREHDCRIIDRSEELSTDNASHYAVIKDALLKIENFEEGYVDYIVVLLGNNCHAYTEHLNAAIELLDEKKTDSVISVSKYNMFHPYRAYKQIANSEYLTSYISQETIENRFMCRSNVLHANDKNAFQSAYFFNGSFWIIKRPVFMSNDGLLPFTWLGKNIYPYIQNEGIMELDAPWQLPLFNS